jgi:hypothetical protein
VYVSQGGKFCIKTEQEGWQAQTPSATYGLDPMFLGDCNASRKYRKALQAVLQDQGHIYKRCAYTFRDDLPGDTLISWTQVIGWTRRTASTTWPSISL